MSLFNDPPAHRNTDPVTSRNAKKFNLNPDRVLAISTHARHPAGLTDYELADLTGKQQNSIGKRRGELCDYGYVEETTIPHRRGPSGSFCIVWRITPAGVAFYRYVRQMLALGIALKDIPL